MPNITRIGQRLRTGNPEIWDQGYYWTRACQLTIKYLSVTVKFLRVIFVLWRHSTWDVCLMSGSPDSSEPVRHVSNVSKLRVLSAGCSGCITHHRTVMSSCRSCPGQAVVKPLQLSGSSPVRTPPYFSGPRTRKWKRKLQLTRKTMWELLLDVRHHDPTLCYQGAPSGGPRGPEGGAPVGGSPADTRQLSAFCQTLLAAWLARRRPGELAGEWFHDVCTKLFCDTATARTSHWAEYCLLGSGFPGYWPALSWHWTASYQWTLISRTRKLLYFVPLTEKGFQLQIHSKYTFSSTWWGPCWAYTV